ncbi:MAG: phytoene/squalene synthase family protein [Anaerolineales bacterium]|nr:phytoene/squalene synthase family protein [Anaerolineales bacterium]
MPLREAYAAAERYIRQQEGMFHSVSMFLPPDRRVAMRVAFAFFRQADNMVDQDKLSLDEFQAWRQMALRPSYEQADPVLAAWADVRERYAIEPRHVNDLLDGIEMDATPRRYATLDELKDYCYHVAGTVGLLSLKLLHLAPGVTFDDAAPQAVELCTALQLTNILRDVGDDLSAGRIYLPGDELAAVGLKYSDIEARVYDERFRALMGHLAGITRQLYASSWSGLSLLSQTGRYVAGAGGIYYRAVLDELERREYNVFGETVRFSMVRKLWVMLMGWPQIVWPNARRQS